MAAVGVIFGDSPSWVAIVPGLDLIEQKLYQKKFGNQKRLEMPLPMIVNREGDGFA